MLRGVLPWRPMLTVAVEYPPFLSGAQVAEYFQSYARHFDLERYIHFGTTVHSVVRDRAEDGWRLSLGGDVVARFDKVVFGTGSQTLPVWPPMPGRDKFQGVVMHGQSYRRWDMCAKRATSCH